MSVILSAPWHDPSNGATQVIGVEWKLLVYTPDTVYDGLGGSPDPTENLVSFNIQKSFTNPVGQATFTMTTQSSNPSLKWDMLPLMSMIVFQVRDDTPGSHFITRFLGYITDVGYSWETTPSSGQRFVTLTCQDPMMGFMTPMFFPTSVMIAPPGQSQSTVSELFMKLYILEAAYAAGSTSLTSFLGYMIQQFTNSEVFPNIIAPSEALWYLMTVIIPNFFNPVTQLDSPYVSSPRIAWKDLFTLFLVPSDALKYSLLYPPSQTSWWQNILPWINAPYFECFGDIRTADELDDLLTYDSILQPTSAVQTATLPASLQNQTQGLSPSAVANVIKAEKNPNPTQSGTDPTMGGTVPIRYGAPGHAVQFDNAGGRFCLVYRNAPYSPDNWESLKMTEIGDTVTQLDQHRSTGQVMNIYEAIDSIYLQTLSTAGGSAANFASLQMPMVFDNQSVLTYGMQNPFQAQVGAYAPDIGDNSALMLTYSMVAWAWYNHNPDFWTGTLTTRGNPGIRIGQRIKLTTTGMEAYVEGITESASIMRGGVQPYQMSIQFSRGMIPPVKDQVNADWVEAMAFLITHQNILSDLKSENPSKVPIPGGL
jgi:hypothetical protein